MDDDTVDTLTVTEEHSHNVRSEGADVVIAVSEWSLGTRSSRGVARLRRALVDQGFAPADISLTNVEHAPLAWVAVVVGLVASFLLAVVRQPVPAILAAGGGVLVWPVLGALQLGTVTATLTVRCNESARIGPLLDRVLASRNAELRSITHRFNPSTDVVENGAPSAVQRANDRAQRIAAALGVEIVSVHRYQETRAEPGSVAPYGTVVPGIAPRRRAGSVAESLGPVSRTGLAGVRVTITYRINGDLRKSRTGG
jgi:hypothetical protein